MKPYKILSAIFALNVISSGFLSFNAAPLKNDKSLQCIYFKSSIGPIELCSNSDKSYVRFKDTSLYEIIKIKTRYYRLKGEGSLKNHYLEITTDKSSGVETISDANLYDKNKKILPIEEAVKLTINDEYGIEKLNIVKYQDVLQSYFLSKDSYPENIKYLNDFVQKNTNYKNIFKEYFKNDKISNLSVDYSQYLNAKNKSIYKDFVVYQTDDCKDSKNCQGYKLYSTGKDGQLIQEDNKLLIVDENTKLDLSGFSKEAPKTEEVIAS